MGTEKNELYSLEKNILLETQGFSAFWIAEQSFTKEALV